MKIDLTDTITEARNYADNIALDAIINEQYLKTPEAGSLDLSLFPQKRVEVKEACRATATQLALMKAEISLFIPASGNCMQERYF
jgi:3-isopropylmalate dehydratase small subunit